MSSFHGEVDNVVLHLIAKTYNSKAIFENEIDDELQIDISNGLAKLSWHIF